MANSLTAQKPKRLRALTVVGYLTILDKSSISKDFPFDKYKILAFSIEGDACTELLRGKGYKQVMNKFNTKAVWEQYFLHQDFSLEKEAGASIR
jgi:hypothetical protein